MTNVDLRDTTLPNTLLLNTQQNQILLGLIFFTKHP